MSISSLRDGGLLYAGRFDAYERLSRFPHSRHNTHHSPWAAQRRWLRGRQKARSRRRWLFAEGASLIFVSDDFDDLASDNSFLPDRIQRDYQLLSEFQTKQLRQPTHLFRGLQVR